MTTRTSTKRARELLSIMALCAGLAGALGCKPEGRGGEPPAAEQAEPIAPAEPAPTEAAKRPTAAAPASPAGRAARYPEPPVPAAPCRSVGAAAGARRAGAGRAGQARAAGQAGKSAAAPTTADECQAAGGSVVPSIAQADLPRGQEVDRHIKLGIEAASAASSCAPRDASITECDAGRSRGETGRASTAIGADGVCGCPERLTRRAAPRRARDRADLSRVVTRSRKKPWTFLTLHELLNI